MTAVKQIAKATKDKRKSEARLVRSLSPWLVDIVQSYKIGKPSVATESIDLLNVALRQGYNAAAKDTLTFDIRQFKQKDNELIEEIQTQLSKQLASNFNTRTIMMGAEITKTANKEADRVSELAIADGWTEREAKSALANRLKNQRLRIATTESQWTVETARKTAVLSVRDPLENTIEQIVNALRSGDPNLANRISRRVSKLAKLPLSISEGDLVQLVTDKRDALLSPITQGEAINNLEQAAKRVRANIKQWQNVGDNNVRETHIEVNGQEQEINHPFVLPGGLVQYPGDASLGADLSEIIKCRCVAVYL